MKVTFSVRASDSHHMTEEHEIDSWDVNGLMVDIGKVVELYRLRSDDHKRRSAIAFPPAEEQKLEPKPEDRDDGPHKRVFEYDGAFKCLDCNSGWGALSGAPRTPPDLCTTNTNFHL